jgi:hypothetical protein
MMVSPRTPRTPAARVNPGAAGPVRFNLRPSVAILELPAREARIVYL